MPLRIILLSIHNENLKIIRLKAIFLLRSYSHYYEESLNWLISIKYLITNTIYNIYINYNYNNYWLLYNIWWVGLELRDDDNYGSFFGKN